MRCQTFNYIYLILFVFSLLWSTILTHLSDPYKLLRVHRTASMPEIRRAYKQLAKEWHPDKNEDPKAETRFVEIKQAYEILSDPDRRKLYDLHGITDEDSAQKRHDYSYYNRFNNDPLDELFASHGGRFHFQDHDITVFHKMSITARQFENNLVPKSDQTAQLVIFYTDWCFPCLQSVQIWRKLCDTLEPLGIALSTVHAGRESSLARKIGVSGLPTLVLVLEGKFFIFKDTLNSVHKVTEFIRTKLPYKLVPNIRDSSLDNFLSGWADNKVRALIFERQNVPRLRYLLTAFYFRKRVSFGFVQIGENCQNIINKYKISSEMDTVLVFNENPSRAIASISMNEIPSQTLHHVIQTNQYLALPRLSNQEILESLCPAEWNRPRKRLCVILVTGETNEHDIARQELRKYAEQSNYSVDRVRFVYLYHEKQFEFIESLKISETDYPLLKIVIIWRRDTNNIKYEWLDSKWCQPEPELTSLSNININDSKLRLDETLNRLLKSSEALPYEAIVKDLLDEHAQNVFSKILTKLFVIIDIIYESLTKDQVLPALSIIATIIFIVGAGYFMSYLVRLEEESIQNEKASKLNGNNNNESSSQQGSPITGARKTQPPRELYLHELRAEKYNGLVRLIKPGCRTLVLFVDTQSRLQLIPAFHRIIWPYRKNKTLMFAHMSLERGLSWYKELLQLSLPEPRELNINPRNCVGTVLSLNGHRKYFCMFHAKHTEKNKNRKNKSKVGKLTEDPELGAFIGFESDTTDSEDEEVLLQGNLLDGLPNWLDRLFEGTTRRYYINYWPDFPTK